LRIQPVFGAMAMGDKINKFGYDCDLFGYRDIRLTGVNYKKMLRSRNRGAPLRTGQGTSAVIETMRGLTDLATSNRPGVLSQDTKLRGPVLRQSDHAGYDDYLSKGRADQLKFLGAKTKFPVLTFNRSSSLIGSKSPLSVNR